MAVLHREVQRLLCCLYCSAGMKKGSDLLVSFFNCPINNLPKQIFLLNKVLLKCNYHDYFFNFNMNLLILFFDNVGGLCVKCQNYEGDGQTYAIQEVFSCT